MPENTAPTPAPAPDPGPGPERGPGPEPGHAVEPAGPPPAVRAQLLATEHWSLLASRSTTQSEVLTRISMFLTLTSAGLLSLALVGQATGFTGLFPVFELSVLGFVTLVGVLTQVRVMNVGIEDLMYVIAMNRIRAGYLGLDPGLAPYLMSSPHDDRPGSEQTYFFFRNRRHASQFLGSSMVFIAAVNAALAGLLTAAVAGTLTAPATVTVGLGALAAVAYLAVALVRSGRRYFGLWTRYSPSFPTRPED